MDRRVAVDPVTIKWSKREQSIMIFDLECDSCAYAEVVEEAANAYTGARDHEADHPTHCVIISESE